MTEAAMNNWKPALVIFLVFLAGVVSGVEGTRIAVRYVIGQTVSNPEIQQRRQELNLANRLRLDQAQRKRLRQVLGDSQQQLQQLRTEAQPRFIAIVSNAETEVQALLTPPQRRQFERLKAENRRLLPLGPPPFPFQRPVGQVQGEQRM